MLQIFRFSPYWLFFLVLTLGPPLGVFSSTSFLSFADENTKSFIHLVAKKKGGSTHHVSTVVRNLRFHDHSDHTRLVLDLQQRVDYATSRTQKPKQIVIQLKDTVLGKKARAKLQHKGFPGTVTITQPQPRKVMISLDMEILTKYTLITLDKPNRLVLDLYPSSGKHPQLNGTKPTTSRIIPTPPQQSQPAKPGEGLLIVIDPGHGGKDPGAIGRRGTKEKDIVLKVAKQLKALITKRLGAKVLMTREKDVFIELEDRAGFANSKKADLFVSIHVNSHTRRSIKGLELYHFGEASDPRALEVAARENGTPLEEQAPAWQYILADKLNDKKIEDSQEFAWTIRKTMVKHLKRHYKVKDHGVKTAPFYVLRMTTMPGILAEIAFVSNPTEEKLLTSKTYQQRVAEGIFEGINAYIAPLQTASR